MRLKVGLILKSNRFKGDDLMWEIIDNVGNYTLKSLDTRNLTRTHARTHFGLESQLKDSKTIKIMP